MHAEVLSFPEGMGRDDPSRGRRRRSRPEGVPDGVWDAVEQLRAMSRVPGLMYREVPLHLCSARYAIAVALQTSGEHDGAHGYAYARGCDAQGWIALLYSLNQNGSLWRCVAYARALLDCEDPDDVLREYYWAAMQRYVEPCGVEKLGGTVSLIKDTACGELEAPSRTACELRVSWSAPTVAGGTTNAAAWVNAWARFVRSLSADEEDMPGE